MTTAQTSGSSDKFLVYGQVFSPDGYSFQQGGIITLELAIGSSKSQIIAAKINETGGYQFDLGGLYFSDFSSEFPNKIKSEALFKVYISHNEPAVEKRFPIDFSTNRQIPNIYLGEVNIDIIPAASGIVN